MASGTIRALPNQIIKTSDIIAKADKTDTVLETTLSRGRKDNTTIGTGSFAFGNYAEASGVFSHAEGVNTVASGARAHSEGSTTKATEDSAHAEGRSTTASGTGSHAEGSSSKATASSAHAEGDNTTASATASHAEGINAVASGSYSHAEGGNTTASGFDSHAEGSNSVASGDFSHAEGYHTIANTKSMHVCGAFNKANVIYPEWVSGTTYFVGDRVKQGNSGYKCKTENSDTTFTSSKWTLLPSTGDMLFVIGSGMYESSRSNAMEVDWDGNGKFSGDVYTRGEKLINSIGTTIVPVYIGDYLAETSYIPSGCVKIGDLFYCVNAPTRSQATSSSSDSGYVMSFNVTSNTVNSWYSQQPVGHANSVTYDTAYNKVYAVPVWSYTSGIETAVNKIFVYSTSFAYESEMETPTAVMGVGFDHIKRKLYYINFQYQIYVYDYVNDSWSLYSTIQNLPEDSEMYDREYDQDFAVYNGTFYLLSKYGKVLYGTIAAGSSQVDRAFSVIPMDSTMRFRLGELKGFDFSTDGHLYGVSYNKLTSEVQNAFVVEIPVGKAIVHSTNLTGNLDSVTDVTLTISSAIQSKFALNTFEIRSAVQLLGMQLGACTIRIDSPVDDPYIIQTAQNIKFDISSTYSVVRFEVLKGTLELYAVTADATLNVDTISYVVSCQKSGAVHFTGSYPLKINTFDMTEKTGNLVSVRDDVLPLVTFKHLPVSLSGIGFYVGQNRLLEDNAFYYGNICQTYYSSGEEYVIPSLTSLHGYVVGTSLQLTLPLPKSAGTSNRNVTITEGRIEVRTVNGFLNGNATGANLNLMNSADCIVSASSNRNTLFIRVTPAVVNNLPDSTPVEVLATHDIHILF